MATGDWQMAHARPQSVLSRPPSGPVSRGACHNGERWRREMFVTWAAIERRLDKLKARRASERALNGRARKSTGFARTFAPWPRVLMSAVTELVQCFQRSSRHSGKRAGVGRPSLSLGSARLDDKVRESRRDEARPHFRQADDATRQLDLIERRISANSKHCADFGQQNVSADPNWLARH